MHSSVPTCRCWCRHLANLISMCHCVCLCRLHVPLGRPASAFGTDPASTTIRSRCPTIIPMINCRNHVRAVSFSRVPRKPSIPRTHGQGHFCRRGLPNWSADTQIDYWSAAVYICLAAGTPVAIESAWRELKPKSCKACTGCGYILCCTCKGRGKVGGLGFGVAVPEQANKCPKCGGTGHNDCGGCETTGLANSWLWTPVTKDGGWGPRGNGPGGWQD